MSEPFDLDRFFALPRLSSLRLAPDGSRLVVSVARPAADGKRFAATIWEVDPAGGGARRLTRSTKGESVGTFLPDGSLLFTSGRPDPDLKPDEQKEDAPSALWLLPAGGGEARVIAAPAGGVGGVAVARTAGTLAIVSGVVPGADLEADAAKEKARKEAGVGALLFESFPIRYWDHYLGPRADHVLVAAAPSGREERAGELRDLTPDADNRTLTEVMPGISPDGGTVVIPWVDQSLGLHRETANLVAIDVATGTRRPLTTGENFYGDHPVVSPDGRTVAAVELGIGRPDFLPPARLHLIDLATGAIREVATELDRWPHDLTWSADGTALFFLADDDGGTRPFRLDVRSGAVVRLGDEGSYADLCPSPDGASIYALRSLPTRPGHVVRISATGPSAATVIPSPATPEADLPRRARVERIETRAADGSRVPSWLFLPPSASASAPAPLVVFVHGGPIGSWVGWHWRWNAHLLAERGYAVLMPDPALSTGYGQRYLERGWGRWGSTIYEDVIAAVDAALARPDLDASRTALMGGSFGGYMANWVAGHTDRFRCIVTHASLWQLSGFYGTTDHGPWWEQEFGNPFEDDRVYRENDPAASLANIRTPMLVIHGELDHRVPISEGLQLWTALQRSGVPSKFLYFPDENHWILKPQNGRVWYETVLAFLDEHVLGTPFVRPALL
ncbi:MAG: hypothetical protein RL338_853 [Chloroflexota bacterium]